jgi:hypothetical protein
MSYAIQNSEGKHLGFLLMAGDNGSGDCIFRSLPNEKGVFDSVESECLYELQCMGEFTYRLEGGQTEICNSHKSIVLKGGSILADNNKFRVKKLET